MNTHLPFTSVVGQDRAKQALLLAAVDPMLGGVLLRGDKGSAKTTLARGLAGLLPGDAPFVELPLGAAEDRVLGSIDLRALLADGTHAFRPGLLASAHGGVLYVDEINLLADHLVDVLLDVAASGVNRVERDGVSHTHPARFVLVASMNPEEGELRPQLLDRFGVSVEVRAPVEIAERVVAVRRQLALEADAATDDAAELAELRARVAKARERVAGVRVDDEVLQVASSVAVAAGAEGLRADLMLIRASRARAALAGHDAVDVDDLRDVAELVLAHRRRRRPFELPGIDPAELDEAFAQAAPDRSPPAAPVAGAEDPAPSQPERPSHRATPPEVGEAAGEAGAAPRERVDAPAEAATSGLSLAKLRAVPSRGPASGSTHSGRSPVRGATDESGARGRTIGTVPFDGRLPVDPVGSAVAVATRRATELADAAAAVAPGSSSGSSSGAPLAVCPEDLRGARRDARIGSLVVFVLDASGSMGVEHRMALTKGVVIELLADAYRRRCRVALVTFRGEGAQTVLRPTSSVEVARARLAEIATGGATPIAAGLREARRLVEQARGRERLVTVVVVTDGRATAANGEARVAFADAVDAAGALAAAGVQLVVVDCEQGPNRLGMARRLAEQIGAAHLLLSQFDRFVTDGHIVAGLTPPVAQPRQEHPHAGT